MNDRILLIQTFKPVGMGGPRPPLELLYIFSAVTMKFRDKYRMTIIDTGLYNNDMRAIERLIRSFAPGAVIFSSRIWEADILHRLAGLVKTIDDNTLNIVTGELPALAGKAVFEDANIDFSIRGEPEKRILSLLENPESLHQHGILSRHDRETEYPAEEYFIYDLDNYPILPDAWEQVDIKAYSGFSNWNGALKRRLFLPILSSRGCPYDCYYCCYSRTYGKTFRSRSPENVVEEIALLSARYNVKEFHFYDAVFNHDINRAKEICRLIIGSGMDISLAFPHGIRADCMDDELIYLLRKAGTYKLFFGIETASQRLQSVINKNLDIRSLDAVIEKTSASGIITGGYFMLGFPGETPDEMKDTAAFAKRSSLDLAFFFKVTHFDELVKKYDAYYTLLYDTGKDSGFDDFSYFSIGRAIPGMAPGALDRTILSAQKDFYLDAGRLFRLFMKTSNKPGFFINLFKLAALILQSVLLAAVLKGRPEADE
ncbi:MAG: radical SAM protein [Elusimicrobia bacterium]|nr:radical SAM protein [Elusimicrobiota bacterium]